MGQKLGASPPIWGGGLSSRLAQCDLDQGLLHAKFRLDPSSRLATMDMDRKLGRRLHPLFGKGELGPHLTQSPGPRPTSIPSGILIHPAIWPQQMGRKLALCPFGERGGGSQSNAMWPGPKPTCVPIKFHIGPSNRLATVRQRYRQDRQTDRQDRQDRTTVRWHRANRFTNGRPMKHLEKFLSEIRKSGLKMNIVKCNCVILPLLM